MPWDTTVEVRVEVPGGSVWCQTVGDLGGVPFVTLHGGPGYPSDSLEPLAALATDRPVVFYDQLGCGRSERPDDPSLWVVERFVAELAAVLDAIDASVADLFGHSWGTMLAVEFTLAYPQRVRSLVLASPALSASRWTADCDRLIAALPAEIAAIHRDPDATPEDVARLNREFSRRHFCRLDPYPDAMLRAGDGLGRQVYETMWGVNEFTPTGNLSDYERADDLAGITLPTLFTCGRHDEATPESTGYYASRMAAAEVAVFEDSAHMAFHEEPMPYLETVRAFLSAQ